MSRQLLLRRWPLPITTADCAVSRSNSTWVASKQEHKAVIAIPNCTSVQLSTGKLARLADGSVLARAGRTAVLAAAVPSNTGGSFSVAYREKNIATHQLPPIIWGRSQNERITKSLIDRSLRPLFPAHCTHSKQVVCNVLAADGVHDSRVLAINAASACLAVSGMAWNGPVGAVRLAWLQDELVINPTKRQLEKSRLNLVVSGLQNGNAVMIEAAADNIEPSVLLHAIETGLEHCSKLAQGIHEFARQWHHHRKVDKEKSASAAELFHEAYQDLNILARHALLNVGRSAAHGSFDSARIVKIRETALEDVRTIYPNCDYRLLSGAFHQLCRDIWAELVVKRDETDSGDSSTPDIEYACHLFKSLQGSALIQFGRTQVLSKVTLESLDSLVTLDPLEMVLQDCGEKNFSLATSVRFCNGQPKSSQAIFLENSLRAVVPKTFPYMIRLSTEVLEQHGAPLAALVSGSCLSLLDAGVPLSDTVMGTTVDVVTHKNQSRIVCDRDGHQLGNMNFQIAGTRTGVTALHASIRLADGLPIDLVQSAVFAGTKNINRLLKCVDYKPVRANHSYNWPVSDTLRIPAELNDGNLPRPLINYLLQITRETGVQFYSMTKDEWTMFAQTNEAIQEARTRIKELLVSHSTFIYHNEPSEELHHSDHQSPSGEKKYQETQLKARCDKKEQGNIDSGDQGSYLKRSKDEYVHSPTPANKVEDYMDQLLDSYMTYQAELGSAQSRFNEVVNTIEATTKKITFLESTSFSNEILSEAFKKKSYHLWTSSMEQKRAIRETIQNCQSRLKELHEAMEAAKAHVKAPPETATSFEEEAPFMAVCKNNAILRSEVEANDNLVSRGDRETSIALDRDQLVPAVERQITRAKAKPFTYLPQEVARASLARLDTLNELCQNLPAEEISERFRLYRFYRHEEEVQLLLQDMEMWYRNAALAKQFVTTVNKSETRAENSQWERALGRISESLMLIAVKRDTRRISELLDHLNAFQIVLNNAFNTEVLVLQNLNLYSWFNKGALNMNTNSEVMMDFLEGRRIRHLHQVGATFSDQVELFSEFLKFGVGEEPWLTPAVAQWLQNRVNECYSSRSSAHGFVKLLFSKNIAWLAYAETQRQKRELAELFPHLEVIGSGNREALNEQVVRVESDLQSFPAQFDAELEKNDSDDFRLIKLLQTKRCNADELRGLYFNLGRT